MGKSSLLIALFLWNAATGFSSCSEDTPISENGQTVLPGNEDENNENEETTTSGTMNIKIGDHIFTATLADNNTAKAFKALLPLTITMKELNGNEKYHYLPDALPTDASRPGTIHAGDIMLYGSTCVVLFYETFSSSYSYTRIGSVDNPDGLQEAVGTGDVSVTFDIR